MYILRSGQHVLWRRCRGLNNSPLVMGHKSVHVFLVQQLSHPLSAIDEEKLLRVLRDHKSVIALSLADIKGLRPSICMHCILLEEDSKPTI